MPSDQSLGPLALAIKPKRFEWTGKENPGIWAGLLMDTQTLPVKPRRIHAKRAATLSGSGSSAEEGIWPITASAGY